MLHLLTPLLTSSAATEYPWPSSARPTGDEPLLVVSTKNLAKADVVTVETLSGALAREAPRIFTIGGELSDTSDANTFWLTRLRDAHNVTLDTRFLHDVPGLLKSFAQAAAATSQQKPLIRGFVRYSEATNSTNAALIACAAMGTDAATGGVGVVVAAASGSATIAALGALGVPQVTDATGQSAGDAFAHWADPAHGGELSSSLSVFQPDDGAKSQCMAGYAVFGRAPTVEYQTDTDMFPHGGEEAEAVLARVAANPTLGVSMGWGPEYQLVEHSAGAGAWVHASDWSSDLAQLSNLPAHSGVRAGAATVAARRGVGAAPARAAAAAGAAAAAAAAASLSSASAADTAVVAAATVPPADPVHTVAFLMSDGDNLCWLQGGWALQPQWWASPQRGQVPIGWTFSPAAQRLFPTVLDYAHEQATSNDVLVAGPSGAGYTYPSRLPAALQAPYANMTSALMRASAMRTLNVIDDFPTADTLAPLLEQEGVDALFTYTYADYYAGLRGTVTWVGDKPLIGARIALWDDAGPADVGKKDALGVEALVDMLATLPKTPASANGYSVVSVNAWSHNVSDVVRAAELLKQRGGFRVITPDALAAELVANVPHVDQCPTPVGSWRGACEASTCTMSGNGTCVLECQCKGALGKMKTERCDLNVCSNLAVNALGKFTCGGKVCPG